MKKYICLLFLFSIVLMLAACDGGQQAPTVTRVQDPTPTPAAATPAPEPTPEPAEEYPEDEESEEPYIPEEPSTQEELLLRMDMATDELLATFSYLHQFDYAALREDRVPTSYNYQAIGGAKLVIWTNRPLTNFAVIQITTDFINDELFYIPLQSYGHIGQLLPGQGFVVHNYIGVGTLPWSGVSFVDEDGTQRFFWMQQNMAYPDQGNPWEIREFEDRTDELPEGWEP